MRRQYLKAGPLYRRKLLDQAVEILGYHRKAAIRALLRAPAEQQSRHRVTGRPREYEPEKLLQILKPIWFGALQPCGRRLAALIPEWLPAYEADHRRLDSDLKESLLAASARTLDRLIKPLRVGMKALGGTRPGS